MKEYFLILLFCILALVAGCGEDLNTSQIQPETMTSLTITENTVAEIKGYSVTVANIYADEDGILRTSVMYWEPAVVDESVRLAEGESLRLSGSDIVVKKISYFENEPGSVTLEWN